MHSKTDHLKFAEDTLEKMWSDLVFLNKPYIFKFFNGCLPQILHGQFLNAMYDKIIRAKFI